MSQCECQAALEDPHPFRAHLAPTLVPHDLHVDPVPLPFELSPDKLPKDWLIQRVELGPVDAEELVILEQLHHCGQAFIQPETLLLLSTHLPGIDGQELEGIERGQRGPGAPGFHVLWSRQAGRPQALGEGEPSPEAQPHTPVSVVPVFSAARSSGPELGLTHLTKISRV